MAPVSPRYELFDHTADLGIRAVAPDRATLIDQLAAGLYGAIGEIVPGPPHDVRALAITAAPATAARDLLTELLHWFEVEALVATDVTVVTWNPTTLRVEVSLATIDAGRSVLAHEVKAVTYHELAIREVDGGWEAVVIVDI